MQGQRQPMAIGVAAGLQASCCGLGPVLFCALARLAAICFSLAIEVLLLFGGVVRVGARQRSPGDTRC